MRSSSTEGIQRRRNGPAARPGRQADARVVKIGDSTLMLVDEMPDWRRARPEGAEGLAGHDSPVRQGCRAAVAQAVAAGAKVTMPVADMFWGDRYGQVEDPFGHRWSVATHKRDVTPDEMQEAMAKKGPMSWPGVNERSMKNRKELPCKRSPHASGSTAGGRGREVLHRRVPQFAHRRRDALRRRGAGPEGQGAVGVVRAGRRGIHGAQRRAGVPLFAGHFVFREMRDAGGSR